MNIPFGDDALVSAWSAYRLASPDTFSTREEFVQFARWLFPHANKRMIRELVRLCAPGASRLTIAQINIVASASPFIGADHTANLLERIFEVNELARIAPPLLASTHNQLSSIYANVPEAWRRAKLTQSLIIDGVVEVVARYFPDYRVQDTLPWALFAESAVEFDLENEHLLWGMSSKSEQTTLRLLRNPRIPMRTKFDLLQMSKLSTRTADKLFTQSDERALVLALAIADKLSRRMMNMLARNPGDRELRLAALSSKRVDHDYRNEVALDRANRDDVRVTAIDYDTPVCIIDELALDEDESDSLRKYVLQFGASEEVVAGLLLHRPELLPPAPVNVFRHTSIEFRDRVVLDQEFASVPIGIKRELLSCGRCGAATYRKVIADRQWKSLRQAAYYGATMKLRDELVFNRRLSRDRRVSYLHSKCSPQTYQRFLADPNQHPLLKIEAVTSVYCPSDVSQSALHSDLFDQMTNSDVARIIGSLAAAKMLRAEDIARTKDRIDADNAIVVARSSVAPDDWRYEFPASRRIAQVSQLAHQTGFAKQARRANSWEDLPDIGDDPLEMPNAASVLQGKIVGTLLVNPLPRVLDMKNIGTEFHNCLREGEYRQLAEHGDAIVCTLIDPLTEKQEYVAAFVRTAAGWQLEDLEPPRPNAQTTVATPVAIKRGMRMLARELTQFEFANSVGVA